MVPVIAYVYDMMVVYIYEYMVSVCIDVRLILAILVALYPLLDIFMLVCNYVVNFRIIY